MNGVVSSIAGAPVVPLIVLKVTLLFGTATVALWALRRTSASLRHLVVALAFGGSLVVPALALALPAWRIIPSPVALPRQVTQGMAEPSPAAGGRTEEVVPGDALSDGARQPAVVGASAAPAAISWPRALGISWAIGAAALLALLVVRSLAMSLTIRRAPPFHDAGWLELLEDSRKALGIRRAVELRRRGSGGMPLVWGMRRPVILLPEECASWSPDWRRAVLVHELAHVARRDILWVILGHVSCALHWFNPLAWSLQRRLAVERERACDDVALHQGVRATRYAGHLVKIASTYGKPRSLAPVMAARSQLEGRIMAILDSDRDRRSASVAAQLTIAALVLAMLVPLSSLGWAAPPPSADDAVMISSDSARFRQHLDELGYAPHDVERFIDGLASPSALTRGACAWALGRAGDPRAVEPLIGVLRDTDATVREWAVRSLGEFPDERSVEPLIDRLTDRHAAVREWAARSLAEAGDERAVEPLTDSLSDSDADVREWAARSLGELRDERAIEPLRNSLETDASTAVREWAARSLGEFAEKPRWTDRRPAVEPLMPALDNHVPRGRSSDPRTMESLIATLDNNEANVREWAVRSLGDVGDDRAVQPLIEMLTDRNVDVREWALRSLGSIRDPRAVEPMLGTLVDDEVTIREWSARGLGVLQDGRMVEPLIERLGDESAVVREWAARALGAYGDSRAIDPLTRLLDDESADVRRWAERALDHIRGMG